MRVREISILLLVVAGVLVGRSSAHASERRVELYEARYRAAAELVPLAEVAMGTSGTATLDPHTNAILLVGPEHDVATALEILRAQDRAPRPIVVRQQWIGASTLLDSGVGVRWSAGSGDVRVGNIVRPSPNNAVAVQAWADFRSMHEQRSEELTLLEGASARIETGTVVPYFTNSDAAGRGDSGERNNMTWVESPVGFATRARVLGDGRIHVELSSIRSTPGKQGTLDRASAVTALELQPGEIRVLGGMRARRDETRSDSGRSVERGRDEESLVLLVSAEVVSAAEK